MEDHALALEPGIVARGPVEFFLAEARCLRRLELDLGLCCDGAQGAQTRAK